MKESWVTVKISALLTSWHPLPLLLNTDMLLPHPLPQLSFCCPIYSPTRLAFNYGGDKKRCLYTCWNRCTDAQIWNPNPPLPQKNPPSLFWPSSLLSLPLHSPPEATTDCWFCKGLYSFFFSSPWSDIFLYLIVRIEGIKLEITYAGITLTPLTWGLWDRMRVKRCHKRDGGRGKRLWDLMDLDDCGYMTR